MLAAAINFFRGGVMFEDNSKCSVKRILFTCNLENVQKKYDQSLKYVEIAYCDFQHFDPVPPCLTWALGVFQRPSWVARAWHTSRGVIFFALTWNDPLNDRSSLTISSD